MAAYVKFTAQSQSGFDRIVAISADHITFIEQLDAKHVRIHLGTQSIIVERQIDEAVTMATAGRKASDLEEK